MGHYRNYEFTFASGATSTNKQFVGPHTRAYIVTSGMVNWAAGTGNNTIEMRGGLSATDTHALVLSASIATYSATKSIYHMPHGSLEFASIGFGTACTGGTANTINLVVYEG